jgi:hypothetical protein
MMGVEPMTSSLPRKRSTTELHRLIEINSNQIIDYEVNKIFHVMFILSTLKNQIGKRGSNPRPQPWKGCALPAELLPHYILYSYYDLISRF